MSSSSCRRVACRRSEKDWQQIDERIIALYSRESRKHPGRPITGTEVLDILHLENYDISPKQYSTRLQKCGLKRNTSRGLVMTEMRRQQKLGFKNDDVMSRPIQNYVKRHKLHLIANNLSSDTLERQLLRNIRKYAVESFGHGTWAAVSKESLIQSSGNTQVEKSSLHALQRNILLGMKKTPSSKQARSKESAIHFKLALRCVEQIVCGTYHDHIPNLIRLVTDLHQAGIDDVATDLLKHLQTNARRLDETKDARHDIFDQFGQIDVEQILGLEEAIQTVFRDLFAQHIGEQSYNTFVMIKDNARRRLLQNSQARLGAYLPHVSELDRSYGPNERRSMDVIMLETEVLLARHCLAQAKDKVKLLLSRANACVHDEWLQMYYLTGGTFFLGKILAAHNEHVQACSAFLEFLELERRFQNLCSGYIFEGERALAWQMLGVLELPTTPDEDPRPHNWAERMQDEDAYMEAIEGWTLI